MRSKISVWSMATLIISSLVAGVVYAEVKKNEDASLQTAEDRGTLIAYYFHGNFRCANCKKIEQYSQEAIEKYFTEELNTKKLTFTIINTDLPHNKHFLEDYQLYTRSLVIAGFKDGTQVRWKNLTKVWNYLNDRDKFYEYVKSEIQKYLEQI